MVTCLLCNAKGYWSFISEFQELKTIYEEKLQGFKIQTIAGRGFRWDED